MEPFSSFWRSAVQGLVTGVTFRLPSSGLPSVSFRWPASLQHHSSGLCMDSSSAGVEAAGRALSSSCGRECRAYLSIWLRECRAAVEVLRKIGVLRTRSFMGRLSRLRYRPIGGMDPRATPQSAVMKLPDNNQMQRTGAAQAMGARRRSEC